MKQCFKCGQCLPLAAFYRHPRMADGHLNKCKECTKKDVRMHYAETHDERRAYEKKRNQEPARKADHLEYQRRRRANSPEKVAARAAVGNALRDGRLQRQPCQVCGAEDRVEAHHDDYARPLEVRWLCFEHHRQHHGQLAYLETTPA